MVKVCVPMAIQVVIDDVGWWSGEDGSAKGEPFRTGIARDHVVQDYTAIIELGKRLNMCPQAAFVLCEWDRGDILKDLPSSTWMGTKWNNSRWVGAWLEDAARVIRSGAGHIEVALHGIGHEYWENGAVSRAEWYDCNGTMRPKEEIVKHIDFYRRLLRDCGIGEFPQSFVPAAFCYRFGDEDGLAGILAENGVKYISTPFNCMHRDSEPQGAIFGVDKGIITVDRGTDLFNWNIIAPEPEGEIRGPICGMHWPHLLHPDPDRNIEVVERWVRYLSQYDMRFDRMLARNTAEAFSQLVYYWGTKIAMDGNEIFFDFGDMASLHASGLLDYFYIKVEGSVKPAFVSRELEVIHIDNTRDPACSVIKIKRNASCKGGKIILEK